MSDADTALAAYHRKLDRREWAVIFTLAAVAVPLGAWLGRALCALSW